MSKPIYNGKTCSLGNKTISVDDCFCGDERQLPMYDLLEQRTYLPDLREEVVLCNEFNSVDKLFSEVNYFADNSYATRPRTNPYYTLQQDPNRDHTFGVGKAAAIAEDGASVTVPVSGDYVNPSGQYTTPQVGYRATIRGAKGRTTQDVRITAVTPNATTGGFDVELTPINNQDLDLTKADCHKLFMHPMREYEKCDEECIKTDRRLGSYPTMVKHYIQRYERGVCLTQDQISGYVFGKDLHIAEGFDPRTGKVRDMVYIPEIQQDLVYEHQLQRSWIALYGERDEVTGQGLNGLIPTALGMGSLNFCYDKTCEISLVQQLKWLARKISKTNAPKEYMLLHDQEFGFDFGESMAQLVNSYGQNCTFSLFGTQPENFKHFHGRFKDFMYGGVSFRCYQMDSFDNPSLGGGLHEGIGILVPAQKYKTTGGRRVAPVEFVEMQGRDNSYDNFLWSDDARKRGCRTVKIYKSNTFGLEIHCACHLGVIQSSKC